MGGGGTDTVDTTQTVKLPAWVEQASQQLFETAQPIAEREYPFYDDARIASFNPDQLASFDLARSQVGAWEPSFFNAFAGYGAAGDQFNPWAAPAYASPYQMAIAGPAEPFVGQSGEFAYQAGAAGTPYSDPGIANMFIRAGIDPALFGAYSTLGGSTGQSAFMDPALSRMFLQAGVGAPTAGAYGALGQASGGTPYTDPFLASFFGEQGTGRGTEAAYGALGAGQSQVSGADISQYMNPYVQQVQQTTIEELNRQYERDRNTRNAEMVARGSYLNEDRREVIDNLSRESRDRVIGEMVARTNADAFNTALGQANLDRSRSFQASDQYRGLASDQAGRNFQSLATSMGIREGDLGRILATAQEFRGLAGDQAQRNVQSLATSLGVRSEDLTRLISAAQEYQDIADSESGRNVQALATSLGVRSEDLSRMLSASGQFGNLAQLGAQIGSGGLDAALGTRSDDLSRLLSASGGFAQLAPQAQQLGYADVSSMLGIGAQQQGQTQSEQDLAYNEFLRQFYFPQEQMNWLIGALQGTPYGQTTTGQQPVGSSNELGSALGSAASIAAIAAMFMCWAAREVYGADNPKWLVFREWMLTRAPKWLLRLYLKYGERLARWLRGKDRVKAVLRRWMDTRVQGMARS